MLADRVIEAIKEKRENILSGNVNCIPSKFTRFRGDFIGIQQGMYYLITAAPKCCKTQFTSFLFLYNALEFAYLHPEKIRLKVFYVALEESQDRVLLRYMSYLLYRLSGEKIRLSPSDLKSTDERKVLPEEIIDILESDEYRERFELFDRCVEFIDNRNPTGQYKTIKNYADLHGKSVYTDVEYTDTNTGEIIKHKKFDHYEPDDKSEYVMWYVDHLSLLGLESGKNLRETINKESEYAVIVRNKYGYIPVFIQQQSTNINLFQYFFSYLCVDYSTINLWKKKF